MSALDTVEHGDVHYWHERAVEAQDEVQRLRREDHCEHCRNDHGERTAPYYVLTDYVESSSRSDGQKWFGWSMYTSDGDEENIGVESFDTYAEALSCAAALNAGLNAGLTVEDWKEFTGYPEETRPAR